ncbi:hypothetical protein ACQ4PT_004981 [Festuca glaucescens]
MRSNENTIIDATTPWRHCSWRYDPPDQFQSNAASAAKEAATAAAAPEAAQFAGSDPAYYAMDDGMMDFGMQGYLDMAQGMLIAPPPMMAGSSAADGDDDGEVSLWSY